MAEFKPKTVYVIYVAATPEQVWQALTSPDFTQRYFFGRTVGIEPEVGGAFVLRMPDGRIDVQGRVLDYDPPRKLAVTWRVEWNDDMRQLPECLVTYEIAPAGDAVRLTLTESYSWEVPDAMLAGGRSGWPAILSSLKSVLETGKPMAIKLDPPKEMAAALQQVLAAKPWLRR
jgi:uncharacterized protein YndB with AHSA1/START domain